MRMTRMLYPALTQGDGLITEDAFAESATVEGAPVRCLKSGMTYIYRPVDGPFGTWASLKSPEGCLRMIAWCPTHCHHGGRNVMLENGSVVSLPERIFQKAIVAGLVLTGEDLERAIEERM